MYGNCLGKCKFVNIEFTFSFSFSTRNCMTKSIIVYSFQGIKDPLFEGLILQYLKKANKNKAYHFHIITHEQYLTSQEEKLSFVKSLENYNINWYAVQYKNGRFLLLKKAQNFLYSLWLAWRIKRKFKAKVILGYLTIAGAFSYIISKILNLKLIIYCFEPHSDYMVDFGTWSAKSLKYRLLNAFEKLEARDCDYLLVPTSHTLKLVKSWNPRAKKILQVPISVDTEKFKFSEQHRNQLRNKHGIEDRTVAFYLGKFGSLYYDEKEYALFCKLLYQHNPNFYFLIVTPNPQEEVENAFLEQGISKDDFIVLPKIPYDEVESYISSADLGMVAIPPFPSQKYRTPVKVGNYLACSLPYLITRGIADDDVLAEKENVGVVFDSLEEKDFEKSVLALDKLLSEDKQALRQRCRKVAITERGLDNAEKAINTLLEAVFE